MSWAIRSSTDESRWFECSGGMQFTADVDTARELVDLQSYGYPLTATGPWQQGVLTPSQLLGAALNLIPAPEVAGDAPTYPPVPSVPGVIY